MSTTGAIATSTLLDAELNLLATGKVIEEDIPVRGAGSGAEWGKKINETKKKTFDLFYAILIIFLSALIFITIFSWFNVLQAYIDGVEINKDYKIIFWARLIYAIWVTLISLALGTIIALVILNFKN